MPAIVCLFAGMARSYKGQTIPSEMIAGGTRSYKIVVPLLQHHG